MKTNKLTFAEILDQFKPEPLSIGESCHIISRMTTQRTGKGKRDKLYQVKHYFKDHYVFETTKNEFIYNNTIIKVADTPQELAQVGDLVECKFDNDYIFKRKIFEVMKIEKGEGYYDMLDEYGNSLNEYNKITKILTPNANGDYIKQWEALK